MEKTTQTNQGVSNLLHVRKDISLGDINTHSNTQEIRNIINLNRGEWIGEESRGLIRVISSDKSSLYNLKYYTLIGADSTQKELIKRVLKKINSPHIVKNKDTKQIPTETPKPTPTKTPKTPHTSKDINPKHLVNTELNQIELIERLLKKVSSWNTRREKAKTTKDKDKFILLGRQLKKDRVLIDQYLKTLTQDSCFSIKDNYIHYQGQFANCKRLIPEGGFLND
jgi:hypothetical protein